MEKLQRDEFSVVAKFLTPASLAACMMVIKTVRTLTEHHYELGFIVDYELQQSKWSRKAFVHDVKTMLNRVAHPCHFDCGASISAKALRVLHLACEHYVYDVQANNVRQSLNLPSYFYIGKYDESSDADYSPA